MGTTFKFSLHKTSYELVFFLCVALMGGGTAFAQHDHNQANAKDQINAHEHDNAHDQIKSATPVKEVALPEGLSSAQSIAIDSTGRIWFTEKVGKKLAVYDPEKKEFATYPLPSSWGKMGFSNITLSPDGEVWFTVTRWVEGAEEPHILGRFTPADGYFTKYAIPHNSIPEELIVDAKGTIWFFASNKNNLYRVDPKTFALKGYPIPTANGNPKSLAADQKGHIWFVESNANKLGEFIPEQEVFQEHEVLTQFANLGKISIDKHGKIWFVEVTANRLGMFSPEQNRFDEAIIPTPGSSPVALVNDDNGNIWFLEYKGNKVGVFNSETATFHEYDIPNFGSLPADMLIDRKRSLIWFTQSATEAKRLGMLSINEALAEKTKQDNAPQTPSVEKASSGQKVSTVVIALLTTALFFGIIIFAIFKLGHNEKAVANLSSNRDMRVAARNALSGKWGGAALVVLVYLPFYLLQALPYVGYVIMLLVGGAFTLGWSIYALKLVRHNDASIGDLFAGFNEFWRSLGAYLLMMIYIFLWTLLLIVPGILAGLSYAMTFYIIADHPEMKVNDAIRLSRKLMEGRRWKFFCQMLSFSGWFILVVLTLGIALFWVLPYLMATIASFYEDVKRDGQLCLEKATSNTSNIL